jgi:hypothetical protein
VSIVDQPQRAGAPHLRFWAAIGLGLISIAASILLLTADGIGGSVHWAHHAGASAAPLLLVAGAITAVSLTRPPNGRHGFMRLAAVLAFTAWGGAQLFPDSVIAGALNDLAILLFVLDAAAVVISDARTLRRPDSNDLAAYRRAGWMREPAFMSCTGPCDHSRTRHVVGGTLAANAPSSGVHAGLHLLTPGD